MVNKSIISKRFVELEGQLAAVEGTKHHVQQEWLSGDYVNEEALTAWRLKARTLVAEVCGTDSEYYRQFLASQDNQPYMTNYDTMKTIKAVFMAIKQDYDAGYIVSIRNIIQAEVFSTELEQAQELLSNGYTTAAAVIAGVVLETSLRQMCADNGIQPGKLDKMNADLSKAGIYNLFVQKKITALADIRNNAAHGNPDKFNKNDVKEMISYVESFMSERM